MSESRVGRIGQIKIYVGKCFRSFILSKRPIQKADTIITFIGLSLIWKS